MTDGNGGTAQATVEIRVTPVNDNPVAANDNFSTDEDVALTGDLLSNDSDVDGDTLQVNTTPVAGPTNGTVDLNTDGTFTYTPNANFFGSDSFTYEVTDGNGETAQATVNIIVVSANDAPTNSAVTLTPSLEDNDRIITQEELLANARDVEGDTLSVTDLRIASGNGILSDNGDGTWTYTPAANDDTGVSFSYNVTDGTDNVSGSATLDIQPVNDAPTLDEIGDQTFQEGVDSIVLDVRALGNADDVDDGNSTLDVVLNDPSGLFSLDASTQLITFNGSTDLMDEDEFTQQITVSVIDDELASSKEISFEVIINDAINGVDRDFVPAPPITEVQELNNTDETVSDEVTESLSVDDPAVVDPLALNTTNDNIIDNSVASPEVVAPSSNDQTGADDFSYTEEASVTTDLGSEIDLGLFESNYQSAGFVQETELVSQQLADTYSSRRGGADDGVQVEETQLAALFWQGLDSSNEEYLQRNFDADNANIVAASAGLFSAGLLFAVYGGSIAITTLATQLPAWKSLDISPLISAFDEDDESIHEIVDG